MTNEQSDVLQWLHECNGLDEAEAIVRPNAVATLLELEELGLAFRVMVNGEPIGWRPTTKGSA